MQPNQLGDRLDRPFVAVTVSPGTGEQRAALERLLAEIAGRPGVAQVSVAGQLAGGGADAESDIGLIVQAQPGCWASLWERRAGLVAVLGPHALALDDRRTPAGGEVRYTVLTAGGLRVDVVFRRSGVAARAGEVVLWSDERPATEISPGAGAGEPAPETAPCGAADQAGDLLAAFWLGVLRCAEQIAAGRLWDALSRLEDGRSLFVLLWQLVCCAGRTGCSRDSLVGVLPAGARQRLAAAVPVLGSRQLATALWSLAALMQEEGPALAGEIDRAYPHTGAGLVLGEMGRMLRAASLPWELPSPAVLAVGPDSPVTLRPVTQDNLREVCRLEVAPEQRHVVAPNAISLAEAQFSPERAWFRAIYAAETPVGFLMLWDDPGECKYFLWRLMIDARYQKLGYARRALEALIEHVRSRPGAKSLGVSFHKGPGGPEGFYRRMGFVATGEVSHGEHIAELAL